MSIRRKIFRSRPSTLPQCGFHASCLGFHLNITLVLSMRIFLRPLATGCHLEVGGELPAGFHGWWRQLARLRLHQGYRPFTQLDFCGTLAEKFLPFVLEFNGKWQLASLRCNRGGNRSSLFLPPLGPMTDVGKKRSRCESHHSS